MMRLYYGRVVRGNTKRSPQISQPRMSRFGQSVKCRRISVAVSLAPHRQPQDMRTPVVPAGARTSRPDLAFCAPARRRR